MSWAERMFAVTLITEDLAASRRFYGDAFELMLVNEDDQSVAYRLGGVIVNLLHASAAPGLIDDVAPAAAGTRSLYTIPVDDVDAVCDRLVAKGVELVNGPIDREWGPRTACVSDPFGHLWIITGELR